MKLYFVRHGQSEGNRLSLHQTDTTPLSELGQQQAVLMGARFKTIAIDVIISSPMTRAYATAEEISKVSGKTIVTSELLVERKRPTELEYRPMRDLEVVAIKDTCKEHWDDPSFHYADEENFFDLRERAEKFLVYIKSRQEKSIAVVSHGDFLSFIHCSMAFGKDFQPQIFNHVNNFAHMSNTGITLCETRPDGSWKMIAWNDIAHLGD